MRFLFIVLFTLISASFAQETADKGVSRPLVSEGKEVQKVTENKGVEAGEDIDQSDPYMDALYQKGQYLVYDCIRRHWVCTKELEYKRCIRIRKEALLDYKSILPCAHFDVFNKRKECKKRQQELTDVAKYEQFCFHPSKLENRLTF